MGTAAIQGELWGAKAKDWAEIQEPSWEPVYETVLSQAGVSPGVQLLDIGCGAGGALLIARGLGAQVAGLDASQNLVSVARERLPGAEIEIGEMEALPFPDSTFDLATSFNAFQFAGNVEQAVREARRVLKPGGKLAMLVWGSREHCELMSGTLAPVLALLPPPPAGAPSPLALSEPGVMEGLMDRAGLSPVASGEFDCEFVYPDADTALRAISSAGILVRAMRQLGEDRVKDTLAGTFGKFRRADGSIIHKNRFRWAIAERV